MKNIFLIIIFISGVLFAQTPFTKGVNLTNWFQSNSPLEIDFTKYTKQDFIYLKSIGCDVIRLPIKLHSMTDGTQRHNLDTYFLFLLDQVVDWAEDVNINLILDNHSFSSSIATNYNIDKILLPVWQNMAEHFKDRSNIILYEILNEPHGISNLRWNKIQESAVKAIREIDSVHTIIVGAANFNGYKDLDSLYYYTDKNLIYTFHFYDPFLFTHQGAYWTSISMENIKNVPFPFNKSKMPPLSGVYKNTWIESIYNNYNTEGTYYHIRKLLDIAKTFKEVRKVPVFCGEFGVFGFHSSINDRIKWYNYLTKYFEKYNIPWTVWDYEGDFGLLKQGNSQDVNKSLFSSLGFSYSEKKYSDKSKISNAFPIFTNFVEKGILPIKTTSPEKTSYSFVQQSKNDFSIQWENPEKFNSLVFDFYPDLDMSSYRSKNFVLSFKVKTNTNKIKFDVRFVDTKRDILTDHNWRNSVTINTEKINSCYNNWCEIEIPLSEFAEKGSWDNGKWYEPKGKFDWSEVDKLEFTLEHESLLGKSIWIDDIELRKNE